MERPLVIFVDVDDTLVRSVGTKRIPLPAVIAQVRRWKEAGAALHCWSAGGADYARSTAIELGVADCFVAFLPKPQVLVDDTELARWKLVELHPGECAVPIEELREKLG